MDSVSTSSGRKRKTIIALLLLLLAVIIGVIFFVNSRAITAVSMRLQRLVGTVNLYNEAGKEQSLKEKMRLKSGQSLSTAGESLVMVSLDDIKLLTLEQNSLADIKAKGKNLEFDLKQGTLFFNVTEKLQADEKFDINTSSMICGVRGTSAYVGKDATKHEVLMVTDGTVYVDATNPVTGETIHVEVPAGNMITIYLDDEAEGDATISVKMQQFREEDLPPLALDTIAKNKELRDRITKATGFRDDKLKTLAKLSSKPAVTMYGQAAKEFESEGVEDAIPYMGQPADEMTLAATNAVEIAKEDLPLEVAIITGLKGVLDVSVDAGYKDQPLSDLMMTATDCVQQVCVTATDAGVSSEQLISIVGVVTDTMTETTKEMAEAGAVAVDMGEVLVASSEVFVKAIDETKSEGGNAADILSAVNDRSDYVKEVVKTRLEDGDAHNEMAETIKELRGEPADTLVADDDSSEVKDKAASATAPTTVRENSTEGVSTATAQNRSNAAADGNNAATNISDNKTALAESVTGAATPTASNESAAASEGSGASGSSDSGSSSGNTGSGSGQGGSGSDSGNGGSSSTAGSTDNGNQDSGSSSGSSEESSGGSSDASTGGSSTDEGSGEASTGGSSTDEGSGEASTDGSSEETPASYTVTFVNSDGTELSKKTFEENTVPSYDGNEPTKAETAGYTYAFNGWMSGSTTYAKGEALPKVTADTTYTAVFDQTAKTYTVTLDAAGGTINSGSVSSYTYGTGATLPTDVTKSPTAEYTYALDGWYTAASGGSKVTNIGTSDSGNKTFYAHWTQTARTYAINVTAGTGGSAVAKVGGSTVTEAAYGDSVTLTATANTGYKFTTWSDIQGNAGLGGTLTNETVSFTMPAGAVSVSAGFEAETYNVTFIADGGSINSGNITSYTYGVGATLPTAVTKPATSTTKYVFDGWFTEATGGSQVTSIGTTETGSKTFYAHWTDVDKSMHQVRIAATTNGTVTTNVEYQSNRAYVEVRNYPDTDYRLDTLTVKDSTGRPLTLTNVKTPGAADYDIFTMPDDDVTVEATFYDDSKDYSVVGYNEYGVSINPERAKYDEGETVVLTVTKPSGCSILSISCQKEGDTSIEFEVNSENGVYSFVMPDYDAIIEANLAWEIPIELSYVAGGGEVLLKDESGNEITGAVAGDTVKVYVRPYDGFYNSVEGRYRSYGQNSQLSIAIGPKGGGYEEYSFEMPNCDVVFLNVTFEPNAGAYHQLIKDENIPHGSIMLSKTASSIKTGEEVRVYTNAERGYTLDHFVLICEDGSEVTFTGSGFRMPDQSVTVSAVFVKPYLFYTQYDREIVSSFIIRTWEDGADAALAGDRIIARLNVAITNTVFDGIKVLDESGDEVALQFIDAYASGNEMCYEYEFTMPASNVLGIASAYSSSSLNDITVGNISGGTITSSHESARMGDSVTLTVTPDPGNTLKYISVNQRTNGNPVSLRYFNNTYSFTMPDDEVDVSAVFLPTSQTSTSAGPDSLSSELANSDLVFIDSDMTITDLTITSGKALTVASGVMINLSGTVTVSAGAVLNNYGTINNQNDLTINGTFNNYSGHTLNNYGTIIVNGTLVNGDGGSNDGVLNNFEGAVIENSGTIVNNEGSIIRNEGEMNGNDPVGGGTLIDENKDAGDEEEGETTLYSVKLPDSIEGGEVYVSVGTDDGEVEVKKNESTVSDIPEGAKVTLTLIPEDGNVVDEDSLILTGIGGETITMLRYEDAENRLLDERIEAKVLTFIMPAGNVTLVAEFIEKTEDDASQNEDTENPDAINGDKKGTKDKSSDKEKGESESADDKDKSATDPADGNGKSTTDTSKGSEDPGTQGAPGNESNVPSGSGDGTEVGADAGAANANNAAGTVSEGSAEAGTANGNNAAGNVSEVSADPANSNSATGNTVEGNAAAGTAYPSNATGSMIDSAGTDAQSGSDVATSEAATETGASENGSAPANSAEADDDSDTQQNTTGQESPTQGDDDNNSSSSQDADALPENSTDLSSDNTTSDEESAPGDSDDSTENGDEEASQGVNGDGSV